MVSQSQERSASIAGFARAPDLAGALVSRRSAYVFIGLTVAAYAFTLYALWIGIDFGFHWDEPNKYDRVIDSYHSGLLLPRYNDSSGTRAFYQYPSMIFWVSVAAVADRMVSVVAATGDHAARPAVPFHLHFFLMRARTLAMVISSLGAWWIFIALRLSRSFRPPLAAFIGAAAYLFSWEFGYHARWLAPDMMVAEFTALFILCLAKADRSDKPEGWITAAAVAAGLATSTKYTMAGLVFALWLYVLMTRQKTGKALLLSWLRLGFIAFAAYLAITPGTLLDPLAFTHDLFFEIHHYAYGSYGKYLGVRPHDIHGFSAYLGRMWDYLAFVMMSPAPAIAGSFAALALWGLVPAWRQSRPLAAVLGFVILFYSVLFARQVVFFVRNFLMLLPVFAYLIGVGFDALWQRAATLGDQRTRQGALAFLAIAAAGTLGWNGWEQLSFGRSIVIAEKVPLSIQVAAYVDDHPNGRFALSRRLTIEMEQAGLKLPPNVVDVDHADRVLFRHSEILGARLDEWPGTIRGNLDWIGAREANLNYYSDWAGRDHVLILEVEKARRFGVLAALQSEPVE